MDTFDRVFKREAERVLKQSSGSTEGTVPEPGQRFWIEGSPISKKRPRFSSGKVYNPTFARDQKDRMILKMQYRGLKPIESPVSVSMTFHLPIPQSASKRKKNAILGDFCVGSMDLDNLVKQYLDIMNQIIIKDDRQVINLLAKKIYSDKPGVQIEVFHRG